MPAGRSAAAGSGHSRRRNSASAVQVAYRHAAARRSTTVAIGRFVVREQVGPGGLAIRNYYPEDFSTLPEAGFAPMAEMIAYFSEQFGPYLFEAYGVVVVDTNLRFALEIQTLSLCGLDFATPSEQNERAAAHELVHQWYGVSIATGGSHWPPDSRWPSKRFAPPRPPWWCEAPEAAIRPAGRGAGKRLHAPLAGDGRELNDLIRQVAGTGPVELPPWSLI